jgi:predicted membrane protein
MEFEAIVLLFYTAVFMIFAFLPTISLVLVLIFLLIKLITKDKRKKRNGP